MCRRFRKGFTLIELLIVVAIIGILAAIAVPNLLAALQRSKQKRTMADMHNIASGWEARHVDVNAYLAAGAAPAFTYPSDIALDHPYMLAILTPTYLRELPQYDAWRHDFEFRTKDNAEYFIRSPGKDGIIEGDSYSTFQTKFFECDIIYGNGVFVVYPEGVQTPK